VGSLFQNVGGTQASPRPSCGDATQFKEPWPYDLDGNPRISGGIVDLGAYEYQYWTSGVIYAFAEPHGTINPAGRVDVGVGGTRTFTMSPASYYQIQSVETNGTSLGSVSSFTWSNVVGISTISVSFVATTTTKGTPHWWLADHGWTQDFEAVDNSDTDGDDLLAWQEFAAHTVPTNANTDGDQFDEGIEVAGGSDPTTDDSGCYGPLLANASVYGLYTTNSVGDLSYGNVFLAVTGATIDVTLLMEQANQLTGGSWSNVGAAVHFQAPATSNVYFYRFLGTPVP